MGRQLSLRVRASAGTTALGMRVTDAPVIGAAVDGRSIDTNRYRLRTPDWALRYWAPSDSGAILSLSVPAASTPKLEIVARSQGIPTLPRVTFESPCQCRDAHGKARLAVKNDPSTPPTATGAIQYVKPNDTYSWPGPDAPLTQSSERTGIENK